MSILNFTGPDALITFLEKYFARKGAGGSTSPGGSNTQVQYNNASSFGGSANLTFDGTTLTAAGISSTGNTTLGDASGDSVTINAQTINPANIATGTDDTVVIYNGSSLVTDEIDSRVWGSTLLDGTNGTDNELAIFTDSNSVEGDANLTWDGSLLKIVQDPTGLSGDTGKGEVVTFGTEDGTDTLAAGKLMFLNSSGVWKYADADAASTGGSQLLAIALGTAVSDGLLLRGFFDMATNFQGSFSQGAPVYVSTTAANVGITAPSATGDFVRVVGYCTDTANVIYFNPDGTYIEIS